MSKPTIPTVQTVQSEDTRVPIMEVFGPTIQGEGALIGLPTYFIRVGGCDFACSQCDSMHAVDADEVKQNAVWLEASDIYEAYKHRLNSKRAKWMTLSGGNPAMWKLFPLVTRLQDVGFKVAVETQGSIWNDWLYNANHVTVSPKTPGMGEKFDPDKFLNFMDGLAVPNTANSVCIKMVAFKNQEGDDYVYERDLQFICKVKELLANAQMDSIPFYISLGNPLFRSNDSASLLSGRLLDMYKDLIAEASGYSELNDVPILPQMHVLLWGNKLGV